MIEMLKAMNMRIMIVNEHKPETVKKQKIIQQILSDKDCFKKMDIEIAYMILEDLKIPREEMKNIYKQLI